MSLDSITLLQILRTSFDAEEVAALWIERLQTRLPGEADASRMALLEELGAWETHLRQGPAKLNLDALVLESAELSSRLLTWLEDAGYAGIDESSLDAIRVWSRAFNKVLSAHSLPFRFRRIIPGQRFDHDRMESLATESGHHLRVARALAWIVIQENDEGCRILRRGRVTTS